MPTTLIRLLLACCLCSCSGSTNSESLSQDELFKRDHKTVLREITEMIDADQALRNNLSYGTADLHKIDSMYSYLLAHNMDIDSFLETRNLAGLSAQQRDSVNMQMFNLGKKNTLRMIALIHKYGYPSSSRIDTATHIDPLLLLEHGDQDYKDTLMNMLTRELVQKRIDSAGYEVIRWHMNGRQGYPAVPGLWILHKNPDGTMDTLQQGDVSIN